MARSGAVVKNQADGSAVGDVRYSMLTEAEFQAQNGTNWVLMDGRNVAGSRYATIKSVTNIPDHRGLAPRMKNNGRADGSQDPDGERALGSFQDQQYLSHGHPTGAWQNNDFNGWGTESHAGFAYAASNGTQATNNTGPRGGNETRMRNLAMNAFIKIN